MADLTLKDLTAPVDDLMTFIPPSSSAYRGYLFPGFFGGSQTPSITPNPLAGDAAEAAPSAGEASYVAPPESVQAPTMLSSLRSINPGGGGTSADERAANREKEIRDTGELTDPQEALKAGILGASFLGPTGLASLAATTALNAAGVPPEYTDPLGALLGNASAPFDFRSNTNLRPGYDQAFTTALDSAHRQHLRGPQAGAYALDSAKAATDINAAARPFGVHRNQSAPATPDVTSLNRQTGFAPAAAPAAPTAGSPTAPGIGTAAPTTTAAPIAQPSAPAVPVGRPSGYGAAGAISPTNNYSGVMSSGNPSDLTNRDRGAGGTGASSGNGGGGVGSNAGRRGFSDGGAVTNDQPDEADYWTPYSTRMQGRWQMERASRADGGVITPPNGGEMFRAATQSTMPADVGQTADPYQDKRYNPDPAMTETGGVTDGVPAQLTPGEFVITRDAATEYDPEVLAALNDPRVADQINQLIAQLLGGGEDDPSGAPVGGDDDDSGGGGASDDNSGMGIAGQSASPIDPRAMNATPRGGSMLRSLSRVS